MERTKWEYRHCKWSMYSVSLDEMLERLNRLGEDGWDLVSVTVTSGNYDHYTYFLKRSKE